MINHNKKSSKLKTQAVVAHVQTVGVESAPAAAVAPSHRELPAAGDESEVAVARQFAEQRAPRPDQHGHGRDDEVLETKKKRARRLAFR
jgi:hypothetical protein